MSNGEIVLLDVRPEQEYAAGHITGAWSMPVADIKARLGELPRNQNYVAYCRGPLLRLRRRSCRTAAREWAVRRLAFRMATPEWWLAGTSGPDRGVERPRKPPAAMIRWPRSRSHAGRRTQNEPAILVISYGAVELP